MRHKPNTEVSVAAYVYGGSRDDILGYCLEVLVSVALIFRMVVGFLAALLDWDLAFADGGSCEETRACKACDTS